MKMRDYLQQAIDKDPGYAPVWALLADTYDLMAAYGLLTPQEAAPRARAAAERALQLDHNFVMPMVILAAAKQHYDGTGPEPNANSSGRSS
jgi:hypothetical protein